MERDSLLLTSTYNIFPDAALHFANYAFSNFAGFLYTFWLATISFC